MSDTPSSAPRSLEEIRRRRTIVRLRSIARRDPGRLFSIDHAAEYLDTSISTVRRLLDDGELRRVRLTPQQVRIRADDLIELIERHTESGAQ